MRCNRTKVFFLAEENMPPLAFLPACWQSTQKGLAKTGPSTAIFPRTLYLASSDESHFALSQIRETVW